MIMNFYVAICFTLFFNIYFEFEIKQSFIHILSVRCNINKKRSHYYIYIIDMFDKIAVAYI